MTSRIAGHLRAAAILGLVLTVVAGAGWPAARAQDVESAQEPVPTETPAAVGTLGIFTALCTVESEPAAFVVILTGDELAELAEQEDCEESEPALVSIDGGEAFEAASPTEVTLPVGTHSLTEVYSGAARDVEIVEDEPAELVVTTFQVVAPTEVPAEVATEVPTEEPVDEPIEEPSETATPEPEIQAAAVTGRVTLVTHLCRQGVATDIDLNAIEEWGQRLVACPVVVLPVDVDKVTQNAVVAEQTDPSATYDQTVTYEKNRKTQNKTLTDGGKFTRAATCERDLGNLNGVEGDNRCFDQSGYRFSGIPGGPVTVESPADVAPDTYTFLAGQADPTSDDVVGDPSDLEGIVTLDTTGDGDVTVHLFYAPTPIERRVTIVGHVCPERIQSRGAFDRVGDVYAKLAACGSITLPDDEPPVEGETVGNRTFGIIVRGADKVEQKIADLPFVPDTTCERDLPQSVDDDQFNDRCLDASGYVADDVVQGEIRVNMTRAASGTTFLSTEIGPDPDDEDATVVKRGTEGLTVLNTENDGNLVLHVFFKTRPKPTATPEPTKTPRATRTATKTPKPAATKVSTPRPTNPTPRPSTQVPTQPSGSAGGSVAVATSTPAAVATAAATRASNEGPVIVDDGQQPPDFGNEPNEPNLGDTPGVSSDGGGLPDEAEGDFGPNPVQAPLDDPFGNVEEDPVPGGTGGGSGGGVAIVDDGLPMSPEEEAAEVAADAALAEMDEGEDFSTVGTGRAPTSLAPLLLILTGLGALGVGLLTRRRARAT